MTPILFEKTYGHEWDELEAMLSRLLHRGPAHAPGPPVAADRLAALYRRACEHLALARARAYPISYQQRLERLTADAHQVIYRQQDFGLARLKQILHTGFPRAVRAHAPYVRVAAATFVLPMAIVGLLVFAQPELILSVVSPETASSFEEMYSPSAESIGRRRTADTDWAMFGFYIRNNIGVAFQCFAAGLFAGLGSLFFLAYNGAMGGAVAGYLTERGLSSTFYSFVATHAAFELTAIVLAGAAGLRLGHALVAPGRRTRASALVLAARESTTLIYGVTALLLVAAAVEAFWSSATWVPNGIKYTVAAGCWLAVLIYLRTGRARAS
jgi:uncharacterized membrane protein SpoIIM required for sporulation